MCSRVIGFFYQYYYLNEVFNIKINHAQTQEEESFDMEELDEEWDENQEKGLEIEDISGKEGNDTGYVSCEEKEKIFLTESPCIEEEYSISYPDCNERHYQNYENPIQTYHDKTKSIQDIIIRLSHLVYQIQK